MLAGLFNLKGLTIAGGVGFATGAALGGGAVWKLEELRIAAAKVAPLKAAVVQDRKDRAQEQASAQITADAGQKAAEAQVQIRTVYRDIIKEVPYAVTPASDARCVVPVGFVRVHDAAAAGVSGVPDPAGRADGAASGVELSAVASTVADNYGSANATARQLTDLQDWIRAQAALAAHGQGVASAAPKPTSAP